MTEQSSLQAARENLHYIRKTLEAAGQLTAVSGKSLMVTGVIALAGAAVNHFVTGAPWSAANPRTALSVWTIALVLSVAVVLGGIYQKSQRIGTPVQLPLVRKLLWTLCPALFLGALFTFVAARSGNLDLIPLIWLGCYGAAITSAGQHSVAPVRCMGLCFLASAGAAALCPKEAGLVWLALGFGWLHLIFGTYIAWRHNG
jgi:hypothetical protein